MSIASTYYTPPTGLNDIDLDDFLSELLSCAGQFEKSCKAREVTDDDVKQFVKGRKAPSTDHQADFDEKFAELTRSPVIDKTKSTEIAKLIRRRSPDENKQIKHQTPMSRNVEGEPLRKIPAIKPSQQDNKQFLQQINSCFQSKKITPPVKPPVKEPRDVVMKPDPTFSPKENPSPYPDFLSSSAALKLSNAKKVAAAPTAAPSTSVKKPTVKYLGNFRTPVNAPYKSPIIVNQPQKMEADEKEEEEDHPMLKGIEKDILDIIKNDIVVNTKDVTWEDIAGLEEEKQVIQEAVIMPLLRPDLFEGLRCVPKGILLFGPPGTGKTMIGKCVAAQSQATFFSVSSSSLTSKWIGNSEKIMKALFIYARVNQPAVIFIDEIDSILKKRGDHDHESSVRLKTEFFIQLDGANTTCEEDRLLVIGATNRPEQLDNAAIRRFTKRLYIPLPDKQARHTLIVNLLSKNRHALTQDDVADIASATDGYSGADIKNLCVESSMQPIRLPMAQMLTLDKSMVSLNIFFVITSHNFLSPEQIRPITVNDFHKSLKKVKATVLQKELQDYIEWNKALGSTG